MAMNKAAGSRGQGSSFLLTSSLSSPGQGNRRLPAFRHQDSQTRSTTEWSRVANLEQYQGCEGLGVDIWVREVIRIVAQYCAVVRRVGLVRSTVCGKSEDRLRSRNFVVSNVVLENLDLEWESVNITRQRPIDRNLDWTLHSGPRVGVGKRDGHLQRCERDTTFSCDNGQNRRSGLYLEDVCWISKALVATSFAIIFHLVRFGGLPFLSLAGLKLWAHSRILRYDRVAETNAAICSGKTVGGIGRSTICHLARGERVFG